MLFMDKFYGKIVTNFVMHKSVMLMLVVPGHLYCPYLCLTMVCASSQFYDFEFGSDGLVVFTILPT